MRGEVEVRDAPGLRRTRAAVFERERGVAQLDPADPERESALVAGGGVRLRLGFGRLRGRFAAARQEESGLGSHEVQSEPVDRERRHLELSAQERPQLHAQRDAARPGERRRARRLARHLRLLDEQRRREQSEAELAVVEIAPERRARRRLDLRAGRVARCEPRQRPHEQAERERRERDRHARRAQQPLHDRIRAANSSLTACGLALPPVRFITCPIRKFSTFASPARTRSTSAVIPDHVVHGARDHVRVGHRLEPTLADPRDRIAAALHELRQESARALQRSLTRLHGIDEVGERARREVPPLDLELAVVQHALYVAQQPVRDRLGAGR